MLLRDWLAREDLSFAQFGQTIERTAEAVRRYANGERIPDRETMPKIVRETGGEVTANDFFGIDDPFEAVPTAGANSPSSGNIRLISPSADEAA